MNASVVIIDYVQYIMDEINKIFKGTTNETLWRIYYEVLNLIRFKECKDWMKERVFQKDGYFQQTIYMMDIQNQRKIDGAPLGNSPEFNIWDLWLNNDVHICHDNHLIITKDFTECHDLKVYGSDTKRISWSYRVG